MATIGNAPGGQDGSVGGSEKVPCDDAGTGKYVTIDQIKTYALTAIGALTGLLKSDGNGNISAAVADTDYQSVPSEGAFADGDKTKLDGIEASATADQTGAEIKVAYEAESDTNALTDALLAKLNAIEALADVTDATNVNAAGATMNTDTDVSGNSWVVDEDTMASDLATKVPTQQSVKAYVDAQAEIPQDILGSLPTGDNDDLEPSSLVYEKTCSDSNGDDVIDLHDGETIGRLVTIYLGTKGGTDNAVITPVTALGYTTIKLDTVNQMATLRWEGGTLGWVIVETDGLIDGSNDPVAGAINGIVKGDGAGTISAAVEDTDYQGVPAEGAFADGDKTKLDGIETSADVTDATNVDAAGATMNTDTDVSSNSWVVDEDDMTSDLATKVPTQQSVKAYVDARIPQAVDGTLGTGANTDFEPTKLVYNKTCSDSDGDDVIDLHDGTVVGQMLTIFLGTQGGTDNAVITPVTALSYSTITLDAVNEIATLQWQGATVGWAILYTNGTVA